MRAYIGIKFHRDYRNKAIVNAIASVFEEKDWATVCVIRDSGQKGKIEYSPHKLMKLTFGMIDSCALMIIDLSEKGVGLGIEAGYAFAKGIPIITVARKGADISETLTGISKAVIIYQDLDELRILLDQYIC